MNTWKLILKNKVILPSVFEEMALKIRWFLYVHNLIVDVRLVSAVQKFSFWREISHVIQQHQSLKIIPEAHLNQSFTKECFTLADAFFNHIKEVILNMGQTE